MLGIEPEFSGRAASAFNRSLSHLSSPDLGKSLVEVLFFQVTLVCVKLTKTKEYLKGREESAAN